MTTLPLKVINFYADPGAGKSTTAAGLFNLMKCMGHSVELVTEWAKDATYEKNMVALENQLVVIAEQDRRLRRLVGHCEWAITDSPLPLGLAYCGAEYLPWMEGTIWGAFRRYQNLHVRIVRDLEAHPYQGYGRNQTQDEALNIDAVVAALFHEATAWGDPSIELTPSRQAPYYVYERFVRKDPDDGQEALPLHR